MLLSKDKIDLVMVGGGEKAMKPQMVFWNGRKFVVEKIGLHHTYHRGKILMHVYSVVCSGYFFKIKVNSQTMMARMEMVEEQ